MTDISREGALAHFGVKGMRWGVRNDRPTRAAKKEARKATKIYMKDANARSRERFKSAMKGLTKEEYDALPSKSVKIGVANTEFKRVGASDSKTLRDIAYVSKSVDDHTRYTAVLFPEGQFTEKKFDITVKAAKATISPSKKMRIDTYIETLGQEIPSKNGKATMLGRDAVEGRLNYTMKSKKATSALNDREIGFKTYQKFANTQVMTTPLHQAYFKNIQAKGFNALVDDADQGVLSDLPVILFPKDAGARVISAKPISKVELVDARRNIKSLTSERR